MIYLFCGLIIGTVMGFTGAGGALVAIPLFIQFMDMTLKEASVLSLFAVVIASLSNFISQRKNGNTKLGVMIISASMVGSFLSTPYKKWLPDFYVALLLTAVSLYALYNVWKKTKPVSAFGNVVHKKDVSLLITIIVGLTLGVLTTFTGLGGGVLMVPVLLSIYALSQTEAVATSLLAVGLSSLFSLIIQVSAGAKILWDINLLFLIGGILAAAFILSLFTKKISAAHLMLIRKVVFTAVVILAVVKIF